MLKKHIANVERASTGRQRLGAGGRRKRGVQGRVALGGLGVDAVADSGATAWGWRARVVGGGHLWRELMARRHGRAGGGAPARWQRRAHAVAAHARAAAGASAAAAGGGVGTESEGKGEEREEEEARFGCEFNSCDWLHESQTLED